MITPLRVWRELTKWAGVLACAALIIVWVSSQLSLSRLQIDSDYWIRLYSGLVEIARRDLSAAQPWSGFVEPVEWEALGFSLPRFSFLPHDSGWRLVIPIWILLAVAFFTTVLLFIRDSRRSFPGRCCNCGRPMRTEGISDACKCGYSTALNTNPHMGKLALVHACSKRRVRFMKWVAIAAFVGVAIPYLVSGWARLKFHKSTDTGQWSVYAGGGSVSFDGMSATGSASIRSIAADGLTLAWSGKLTPDYYFRPVYSSSSRNMPLAQSSMQTRRVIVSVWPLLIFLLIPTVVFWLIDRSKRFGRDMCSQCGYDIRGNTTGCCPECGWKIPASQPSAAVVTSNGKPDVTTSAT